MKFSSLSSTLAALSLAIALPPFVSPALAAVPIGEDAVAVGEGAAKIGEDSAPIGEGAEKVGEGSEKVGEGATKIGEDSVSIGEASVPIGEDAQKIGEGAVRVGEGAEPDSDGGLKVGEDTEKVGEGAERVGEDAVKAGEDAEKVGEGAFAAGEGAVPVGEAATPTELGKLQETRLFNRNAAMAAPETAALFSTDPQDQRLARLEENLANAIASDWTLNQAATAERRRENDVWAAATLASAATRPEDLLTVDWWEKHKPASSADGYFLTQASPIWWGGSTWPEMAKIFAFSESTHPFVYVYDQNLTFKNDVIYVNGQAIGAYDDYVASARKLATSRATGPNPNSRWIPLGTFALSTSEKKPKSMHAIQLVTDGIGNIQGTYANWENGTVQAIHGRIDLETQRVAFDIGGRNNLTLECGLTNLTEDKLRLWAHLPGSHSQTWLLVRMHP